MPGKLPSAGDCSSEADPSQGTHSPPAELSRRGEKNTNRGRVDIIRQTAGRGGKAVTVIKNFTGISSPYENPENPEIHVINNHISLNEAADQIINYLVQNNYIEIGD